MTRRPLSPEAPLTAQHAFERRLVAALGRPVEGLVFRPGPRIVVDDPALVLRASLDRTDVLRVHADGITTEILVALVTWRRLCGWSKP